MNRYDDDTQDEFPRFGSSTTLDDDYDRAPVNWPVARRIDPNNPNTKSTATSQPLPTGGGTGRDSIITAAKIQAEAMDRMTQAIKDLTDVIINSREI